MTEIVAAHLERELRNKLGASFSKVVDNETRMQIEQCLMPVVAAVLAACAREARLQEANAAYWAWKLSHEDFGANQQKRLDELRKEG